MEIQDFLIEATKSIAREKLDKTQFTKSYVGLVVDMLLDGECVVKVNEDRLKSFIPLNMRRFVAKGDYVVVQDLFNDRVNRIVHGVIKGSYNGGNGDGGGSSTNIHIYNINTGEIVSSVFQVYNVATSQVVSKKLGVF